MTGRGHPDANRQAPDGRQTHARGRRSDRENARAMMVDAHAKTRFGERSDGVSTLGRTYPSFGGRVRRRSRVSRHDGRMLMVDGCHDTRCRPPGSRQVKTDLCHTPRRRVNIGEIELVGAQQLHGDRRRVPHERGHSHAATGFSRGIRGPGGGMPWNC